MATPLISPGHRAPVRAVKPCLEPRESGTPMKQTRSATQVWSVASGGPRYHLPIHFLQCHAKPLGVRAGERTAAVGAVAHLPVGSKGGRGGRELGATPGDGESASSSSAFRCEKRELLPSSSLMPRSQASWVYQSEALSCSSPAALIFRIGWLRARARAIGRRMPPAGSPPTLDQRGIALARLLAVPLGHFCQSPGSPFSRRVSLPSPRPAVAGSFPAVRAVSPNSLFRAPSRSALAGCGSTFPALPRRTRFLLVVALGLSTRSLICREAFSMLSRFSFDSAVLPAPVPRSVFSASRPFSRASPSAEAAASRSALSFLGSRLSCSSFSCASSRCLGVPFSS